MKTNCNAGNRKNGFIIFPSQKIIVPKQLLLLETLLNRFELQLGPAECIVLTASILTPLFDLSDICGESYIY